MLEQLSKREQEFYQTVSKMLARINAGRATVKSEVYKTHAPLRYYALLDKVVLNYPLLREIASGTELEPHGEETAAILAYELLHGTLIHPKLRKKLKGALGKRSLRDVEKRVFIRLNTLKAGREILEGYNAVETCVPDVFELRNPVEAAGDEAAAKTIKDFHADADARECVKFQNLSSCLPAFVLSPPEDSVVIDATAAPGNKTTHLCSIMRNTGKIYAFERDRERFKLLTKQLREYGATNTQAVCTDFLKTSPNDYKPDYILLDPSCSGSGIHPNYEKSQERVDKLHNFQAMLLNHAFKFGPKKVVYSTCSVHAEEGEDVVKEALEKNPEYEVEAIGDFWKTRGYDGYDFSASVIRAGDDDEGAFGFFVALFKRKDF
ncbi:25S rRNA (cytosine2278-C5)-methyltransferase [Pancytospora philotis]|nr:25S rRNA (cytosine2278-C5)-methyltransferase [Pancytospora philotis]